MWNVQTDSLRQQATHLTKEANESVERQPWLHIQKMAEKMFMEEDAKFRTEDWDTANKSQWHLKAKQNDFHKHNDPNDKCKYHLLGFVNPLNDGARHVSRMLSGFTPLYKQYSHPDLWQMQTVVMTTTVRTLYMGDLDFFRRAECLASFFPSTRSEDIMYGVQNLDPNYVPFWNTAIAAWAVQHVLRNEVALQPWHDIDLIQPCPWYFNRWVMRVLRLEHGHAANHLEDPPRRAMLGACCCVGNTTSRRALVSKEAWRAYMQDECDSGDDEEGDSDAGSINDKVELGLLTSADWDLVTKKSSTPQGNVPHLYPEVVKWELKRNQKYDDTVAARRGGQVLGARAGGQVARDTAASSVIGAGCGGQSGAGAPCGVIR
ncbi:hypothetical protein FRC10_011995 [Ceratobasidium sp. 414]|nr:hypothetical protein FRC10_011995 [Ceratobasidium sp. 414]